jgi:molybdopterin/thiamine biosynthesis adenylyltransferase
MFDETNLNRQALCNRESLGRSKAEAASRVVKSINPAVDVVSHDVTADSSNLTAIITGSDVVVDALDNVRDRFSLEAVAKQLGLPLIHGALAGFEGQLMTIFPEDPGLRLIYGDGEVKGGEFKSPEAILGVPGPTPSMVATLQVMEVLKVLLKRGRLFRNAMVHIDLESGRFEEFTFGPPPR